MELRGLGPAALSPRFRAHLVRAGLVSAAEALLAPPAHLARQTRLSPQECADACAQLARAALPPALRLARARGGAPTAPDLVSTGDPGLDALLGGGVRVGSVTEVAGHSASGKTHLCLQLALEAQRHPSSPGGTLFISSEGSLPSTRLFSLAQHLDDDDPRTPWDYLDNVHAEKAPDVDTLAAVLAYHAPAAIDRVAAHARSHTPLPSSLPASTGADPSLPSQLLLATRTAPPRPPLPIRLVVVDSLAAPFRADATTSTAGFAHRAKELATLGDALKTLAAQYALAVVVVNQVADAFSSSSDEADARPPPSEQPGAPPPPHVQHRLPPLLYSRLQSPHFSGLAASRSTPLLPLPFPTAAGAGAVHAALGHAWSNVPSARLLLLVHRTDARTRRAAALVWGVAAPRAVVETELGERGLTARGDVRGRKVLFRPGETRGAEGVRNEALWEEEGGEEDGAGRAGAEEHLHACASK